MTSSSPASLCLLSGAYGDAFGFAVEFDDWRRIQARFGPKGLREFPQGEPLLATDDTQMALFAAEALLEAPDLSDPESLRRLCAGKFLAWLSAQSGRERSGALPSALASEPSMRARRAPGHTCLSALADLSEGPKAGRIGTPLSPPNNSKGCGAAMRAAPFGLLASSIEQAFEWGCLQGAITHGHPDGYGSAGAFASICHSLLRGASIETAASDAIPLARAARADSTADLLLEALDLGGRRLSPPEIPEILGQGWVGDEALAIAVWAAMASDSLADCAILAANHDGDSDSTAMMGASLRSLAFGVDPSEIPLLELPDMAPLAKDLGARLDDRILALRSSSLKPF